MKIDVESIIREKQYCSERVQLAIEKYANQSINEMLFRNLVEVVIQDELQIDNSKPYHEAFAEAYEEEKNIESCKQAIFNVLSQGLRN